MSSLVAPFFCACSITGPVTSTKSSPSLRMSLAHWSFLIMIFPLRFSFFLHFNCSSMRSIIGWFKVLLISMPSWSFFIFCPFNVTLLPALKSEGLVSSTFSSGLMRICKTSPLWISSLVLNEILPFINLAILPTKSPWWSGRFMLIMSFPWYSL